MPMSAESPSSASHLNQAPVLVLGHGISGQAMARWCVRQGAQVTVADTRHQPELMQRLAQELQALAAPGQVPPQVVCAPLDAALLASQPWACVCKSPGLSPAQLQPVTDWSLHRPAGSVLGELDLFAQGLKQAYAQAGFQPKVLAITGTNGKTTTTSLTGLLLERVGWRVAVAGNIGPAMLDVLLQAMDFEQKKAEMIAEKAQAATEKELVDSASSLPQAWVLELSSFQLDGVRTGPDGFEPTAATVLNITEDHLDWHGSMAHYAAAKFRVFGQQGVRVLNREDAAVMAARPEETLGQSAKASRHRLAAAESAVNQPPEWTSFGTDLPQRPGDWGLEVVNGMAWLVRAQPADETQRQRKGQPQPEPERVLQRLMPAEALRIRGRHNAANALAALALATAAGAPLAPMLHGLREYRGERHRVESVAVLNEVEFFDDSKGTNVGATLAAIRGLGADRRLVMILGGDGKGQDFSPLADAVRTHVQAVVLIGRDAPQLRNVLAPTGVPLFDAVDLPAAVRQAAAQAQPGEAVVLSPACASLDMFRNYGHRAQVFIDTVAELATEQGLTGVGE